MNKHFQHSVPGIIRSIKISTDGLLLCVESLDKILQYPRYFIFDLKTKKLIAERLEVKKDEKIVLKAITDNHLIFNQYADGQNPDVCTAFVYNYATRSIVWEKENFNILAVNEQTVKAPHPYFENRFTFYDIKTGQDLGQENTGKSSPISNQFPDLYPSQSQHFTWFEKFISQVTSHKPELCCEYLELENRLIISYYFFEGDVLVNNLLVANDAGEVIESFPLGKNLKGIGKDTFFVVENNLIFISDKNTLHIYEV